MRWPHAHPHEQVHYEQGVLPASAAPHHPHTVLVVDHIVRSHPSRAHRPTDANLLMGLLLEDHLRARLRFGGHSLPRQLGLPLSLYGLHRDPQGLCAGRHHDGAASLRLALASLHPRRRRLRDQRGLRDRFSGRGAHGHGGRRGHVWFHLLRGGAPYFDAETPRGEAAARGRGPLLHRACFGHVGSHRSAAARRAAIRCRPVLGSAAQDLALLCDRLRARFRCQHHLLPRHPADQRDHAEATLNLA
mmetsp:Transcript_21206/g.48757  ORF Transcript_21206/g.48757 Transcript_21206/m.48757 type:complete len:246 (+) Transcript_21206:358-1095(+)